MKFFFSKIKSNYKISEDFFKIEFLWSSETTPKPGQFFTLNISNKTIPLLRRPFAFAGFNQVKKEASMIYQKRGSGTKILSEKKYGDTLNIIGPIGNYFQLDKLIKKYIIIAGGIGLGPMLFTANYFINQSREVTYILGCQNKLYIPEKDIFSSFKPIFCTDDGSEGFKGTTVDYLNYLDTTKLKNTAIIACGPQPMLKGCHEFAERHNIPCRVSMEQIMACGVGACMGCTIKIAKKPGFARVCSEGPVFNSRDILWT